ncbi:MAG: hypothetical protein CMO12_01980 [Thaumarchaeota archaeon]|nr:hypothetical protein [Nitrososphaerota archaeon]
MNLKVAVMQIDFRRVGWQAGIDAALTLSEKAALKGAQLLSFPEHWLMDSSKESQQELYARFGSLAREYGVFINLGGIYHKQGNKSILASPTIGHDGKIWGLQPKVHLFGEEKLKAIPGKSFDVCKLSGFAIGVVMCHDIVFPESSRALVLKGADLLLNPSLIVDSGISPWHLYVKVRSLENRIPVIAPNILSPPRYPGRGIIVDLKVLQKEQIVLPKARVVTLNAPGFQLVDLDLGLGEAVRKERLRERKPQAYAM